MYEVKLPNFEGPLDLLLHLIKQSEIDIYEVSISQITDQYLKYIELMRMLDLEIASEFLLMASTLLHLKSQMMLPAANRSKKEVNESIREELIKQLIEYKQMKEAAVALDLKVKERSKLFNRPEPLKVSDSGEVAIEATIFDLLSAFKTAIDRLPPEELYEEIAAEEITVESKVEKILAELQIYDKLSFEAVLSDIRLKLELIVAFLAVLELIRLKKIIAIQREPFSEIWIVKKDQTSQEDEPI